MRSFTPSRHLKNLAPPIPTLRRKISVFRYSPATLRGEASKAAVFRRLFTAMQYERASWRRSFNHKIRSAGRKKEGRAGPTTTFNVLC